VRCTFFQKPCSWKSCLPCKNNLTSTAFRLRTRCTYLAKTSRDHSKALDKLYKLRGTSLLAFCFWNVVNTHPYLFFRKLSSRPTGAHIKRSYSWRVQRKTWFRHVGFSKQESEVSTFSAMKSRGDRTFDIRVPNICAEFEAALPFGPSFGIGTCGAGAVRAVRFCKCEFQGARAFLTMGSESPY